MSYTNDHLARIFIRAIMAEQRLEKRSPSGHGGDVWGKVAPLTKASLIRDVNLCPTAFRLSMDNIDSQHRALIDWAKFNKPFTIDRRDGRGAVRTYLTVGEVEAIIRQGRMANYATSECITPVLPCVIHKAEECVVPPAQPPVQSNCLHPDGGRPAKQGDYTLTYRGTNEDEDDEELTLDRAETCDFKPSHNLLEIRFNENGVPVGARVVSGTKCR